MTGKNKMEYKWKCWDCDITVTKDYAMGKSPIRTRCTECNKLIEKDLSTVTFHMKGDCHTNVARGKKFIKEGLNKQEGDALLNRAIDSTKEALADDGQKYKSYNIDYEKLAKHGKATKLNPEQTNKKRELTKKRTQEVYDNAEKQGEQLNVNRKKDQH
jgi:predicted nucleic acid-binding Zn ribbon protein